MSMLMWITRLCGYKPREMSQGRSSAMAFLGALDRERARSDRSGQQFALVLFSLTQQSPENDDLRGLEREIAGRIRQTDQAGRLDGHQVWLILPYTSFEGARALADDICQRVAKQKITPEYTIDVYPPDSDTSDKGPSDAIRDRVSVSETRSEASLKTPVPSRLQISISSLYLPSSGTTVGRDRAGRRGETCASLLIRPMPLWKRALDVTGAAVGLVLISPVMLIAAFAIKLSSPGPLIFSQIRAGLGGRPFRFYKFRTMVANAEGLKNELVHLNEVTGPVFKIKEDPRTTRVGRFLRKTSIDELPQLWNVFKGDMSLVGPRPLPLAEAEACMGWQRRRLDVTPGLTCTWQVSGRCEVEFSVWVRMDIGYVRGRSLSKDVRILLRTLPAVLSQRGAY